MTKFHILLERSAERDLVRLTPEIHDRAIAAIRGLMTDPRPPGCRKLADSQNDWRIRVGDYRVVYEIADEIRVVRVNRVRHRREVYRWQLSSGRSVGEKASARRSLLLAENLTAGLLTPVAHRHWIVSVPRALRGLFERDRKPAIAAASPSSLPPGAGPTLCGGSLLLTYWNARGAPGGCL